MITTTTAAEIMTARSMKIMKDRSMTASTRRAQAWRLRDRIPLWSRLCRARLASAAAADGRALALVQVGADHFHQLLELAVEEVVAVADDFLVDDDALLGLQLLHQGGDVLGRHHRILVAMHDQPGGRAGGEEREVVEVGRRRHRDEALDLGAAHQKLHADPGAEGEPGDPAGARLGVERLRPIQGRSEERRVGKAATWR